ncbi:peptidoglycan-binding domain-containing protein [Streptomyces specialis]|uniref:peptidoglycan-binding domain-containing protein n=1 Tax=Streptomyces specialis TaxID=498367 RepID=UPI00073F404C|nr:peptidoglycan-binding domain-containing protein [Streptomyces specialis]
MAVRRRVRAAALSAVAVAALATGAGTLLGSGLKSPQQAVADARPPEASPVLAAAEERVIHTSVLLRGRVEPGPSVPVTAPAVLPGDPPVVTATPLEPGDELAEGAVALEIAGEPVFAAVIDFPLYRDLAPGLSGPDVRQVQDLLVRLGYPAGTDGEFSPAMAVAVERFYQDRGYRVPEGGVLPRHHLARIDRSGRTLSSAPLRVGDILEGPGAVLLTLDAGQNRVSATAAPDQLPAIPVGAEAEITDEVSGTTARATVASVAEEPAEDESTDGRTVLLEFDGEPLAVPPPHSVRISGGGPASPEPVLAVPVTGLRARPDGETYVTVARRSDPDGGPVTMSETAVRTGATGDGWVAVTPVEGTLRPGTEVVVGLVGGSGPTGSTP